MRVRANNNIEKAWNVGGCGLNAPERNERRRTNKQYEKQITQLISFDLLGKIVCSF